jgi:signal transduction histidine kinase
MARQAIPSPDISRPDALAVRWLRPLGITTVVVVIALSVRERPAPALSGSGLAVTSALVVLAAGFLALVRGSGARNHVLALMAVIAASATLLWTQSGGPGMAGLFVASGYAATRLPTVRSVAILAAALAAFAGAAAHANRSVAVIAAAEFGLIAFYVIAAFARRVQQAHEETKQLLAALEASRRSEQEAVALRERSRIAREIHDVLAHSLSGLMLQLEGARMLAATPNANGELAAALERAHHLAHVGLEEARRAIGALRDDDVPGVQRIEALVADFGRDSSVEATLEVLGTPRALDAETSLTLFRVAQESLTNARKYARPERVELQLAYERDGVRLVVEDHGEQQASMVATRQTKQSGEDGLRAGYGLTGMRERAELRGGTLDAGAIDDGFRVELWIPA